MSNQQATGNPSLVTPAPAVNAARQASLNSPSPLAKETGSGWGMRPLCRGCHPLSRTAQGV